jgi:formate-dependent nitrite reductase membrane component NrfD
LIDEKRLQQIRREAEKIGRVDAKGIRAIGAPFPQATAETGYYGLPLLKPPVWTWEVPAYFFIGGAAGAAAVVGAAARIAGADRDLVRHARWIAAAGAALSTALLIGDLGRPERFLNMLRVFKPQSPMSVGAWTLAVFGTCSGAAALADETFIGDSAAMVSAATGLVLATYTGVLIGATTIPVWSKHVSILPLHFGASAMASAVSLLQLFGHDEKALNFLGLGAAAFETFTATRVDDNVRIAAFFSGPVALVLRTIGLRSRRVRKAAAAASLLGSLLTRIAWMEAGKTSAARDAAGLREQIGEGETKRQRGDREADSSGEQR